MGHTSVADTDVAEPFSGGTMRCTDDGTWLIVHMARKMYSGHQANLLLQVKMSDMSLTENSSTIEYSHMGYVSHSFNQFILHDGTHLATIDHGDAYPRSIILNYYQSDFTTGSFMPDYFETPCIEVNMVSFPAASDDSNMREVNYTGAAIGGFVQSSSHYIIAYNIADQSKLTEYSQNYSDPYTRNIKVAAVPKNDLDDSSVQSYTVTDFAEGEEKAQAPFLIEISEDTFALLWQQGDALNYTTLDGTGKPDGSIYTFSGNLSDCTPVLQSGTLFWYTWKGNQITRYALDTANPSDPQTVSYTLGHDYQIVSEADETGYAALECTKCGETKKITVPAEYTIRWCADADSYVYSSKVPDPMDAGATLKVRAFMDNPASPENQDMMMEITDGADYLIPDDPESLSIARTFTAAQFDPPTVEVAMRIYPKYNPKAAQEFTLTLAHSYELTETVLPTGGEEGYALYTCTGCGHTHKEAFAQLTALSDANVKITADDSECVYNGKAQTVPLTVSVENADGTETVLEEGTDYSAAYSDNIDAGTASVTLTALTGSLYVSGETSAEFQIAPQPISAANIQISETGNRDPEKVLSPDFTVTDTQNHVLTADLDYTYEFSRTEPLLTVTGTGNYTGTVEMPFVVKRIDLSDFVLSYAEDHLETERETFYTGKPHEPEILISDGRGANAGNYLTAGTDYEVTYEDNTDAGTAKVTVTGIGAYQGEIVTYFRIVSLDIKDSTQFTAALESDTYVYSGEAIEPQVTVTAKDGTVLIPEQDYTVTYFENTSAGTAAVKIKGDGNYTGELQLVFTIVPLALTSENCKIKLEYDTVEYDGEEHMPSVTAIIGDNELKSSYILSYANVVNAGTATVDIEFTGNYSGSLSASYEILPVELTEKMLSVSPAALTFSGKEQQPDIKILNDGSWRKGIDYTVEYADNIHAGTAKALVTGKGNYSGTAALEFQILPLDISEKGTLSLERTEYEWTGKAVEPPLTVEFGSTELAADTDYTVEYSKNLVPGRASVTVTGIGDYTGTLTETFEITPYRLTEEMFSLEYTKHPYTGEQLMPQVIPAADANLIENETFFIAYGENTEPGTGSVTITGGSPFTGKITLQFTITPADISKTAEILITNSVMEYDGSEEYTPEVSITNNGIPVSSEDYTLTYCDNQNAGTASVTVEFTGRYTGSAEAHFTILPADLADITAELPEGRAAITYNGKEQKPRITLTLANGFKVNAADYSISYSDNINAGTAAAVVTGKGNLTGKCTVYFEIAPAKLGRMELDRDQFTETGGQICPGVSVYAGDPEEKLTEDTDYTVSYIDNLYAGNACAEVKGIGNYSGVLTEYFEIAPAETTVTATEISETTNTTTAETEITTSSSDFTTFTTTVTEDTQTTRTEAETTAYPTEITTETTTTAKETESAAETSETTNTTTAETEITTSSSDFITFTTTVTEDTQTTRTESETSAYPTEITTETTTSATETESAAETSETTNTTTAETEITTSSSDFTTFTTTVTEDTQPTRTESETTGYQSEITTDTTTSATETEPEHETETSSQETTTIEMPVTEATSEEPVTETTTAEPITGTTTPEPMTETTSAAAEPDETTTEAVTETTPEQTESETTSVTAGTTADSYIDSTETTTSAAQTSETEYAEETTESATTETTAETDEHPSADDIGDFNGDGAVSVADTVLLARFIAEDAVLTQKQLGPQFSAESLDINGDGFVNVLDVIAFLKTLLR